MEGHSAGRKWAGQKSQVARCRGYRLIDETATESVTKEAIDSIGCEQSSKLFQIKEAFKVKLHDYV
jgi:hypothetical protein